jgi:hypothetical protein
MIIISIFLFLFVQTLGFSFEYHEVVFPFRAFVYHAAGVDPHDTKNVTITKETAYTLEFTYQGGNYKATLFTFGAIYLERPNKQNPILITFDMDDYKLDAKFLSIHDYD